MRSRYLQLVLTAALATAGCSAVPEAIFTRYGPTRTSERDRADFERARRLVTELHYEEAAGKFASLAERFALTGDSDRSAQSMFWAGYCYEKLDRLALAEEYYHRLLRRHPQTQSAQRAGQRLAHLAGGG